ncbi:hypothetical protein GGTG_02961 [Gaeumannomyces tritici R3-111a-1]|uniref:Uncharacterized protein n=1 Tax=Gaeumannomyces tritici (strain R3-111a-1) TaxID=644352 RepID=J3NNV5_GAET3|nr:hypothetical protein GGTG_02961 [Gaeumannomyces tritici R3-111a-1]EJT77858.1 hypothetical protein GGTG_02961 [Gaeumannomyces tritici R3-111a-1]
MARPASDGARQESSARPEEAQQVPRRPEKVCACPDVCGHSSQIASATTCLADTVIGTMSISGGFEPEKGALFLGCIPRRPLFTALSTSRYNPVVNSSPRRCQDCGYFLASKAALDCLKQRRRARLSLFAVVHRFTSLLHVPRAHPRRPTLERLELHVAHCTLPFGPVQWNLSLLVAIRRGRPAGRYLSLPHNPPLLEALEFTTIVGKKMVPTPPNSASVRQDRQGDKASAPASAAEQPVSVVACCHNPTASDCSHVRPHPKHLSNPLGPAVQLTPRQETGRTRPSRPPELPRAHQETATATPETVRLDAFPAVEQSRSPQPTPVARSTPRD